MSEYGGLYGVAGLLAFVLLFCLFAAIVSWVQLRRDRNRRLRERERALRKYNYDRPYDWERDA